MSALDEKQLNEMSHDDIAAEAARLIKSVNEKLQNMVFWNKVVGKSKIEFHQFKDISDSDEKFHFEDLNTYAYFGMATIIIPPDVLITSRDVQVFLNVRDVGVDFHYVISSYQSAHYVEAYDATVQGSPEEVFNTYVRRYLYRHVFPFMPERASK